MRVNIPLGVTISTGFIWVFSLMTMALAASFNIKRRNYNIFWNQIIEVSNPAANGMIASNVFNMLYFGFFLFFLFWRPDSIFISMIVDTSFLGFLWLFSIATTGSMTAQAPDFGNCNHAHLGGHCGVGRAAIAFGWLTFLLITGLLVLKVTYTLIHYGKSMDTWKTPFNELVLYGVKGSGLAGRGSGSRPSAARNAEEGSLGPQGGRGGQGGMSQLSYTNSGVGSVSGSERMQTPVGKPEMGEYFPVRQ